MTSIDPTSDPTSASMPPSACGTPPDAGSASASAAGAVSQSTSSPGAAPARAIKGGARASTQLARTLQELESAFSDWESLSTKEDEPEKADAKTAGMGDCQTAGLASEQEFRHKTKKLLCQLREQLNELND